jgi:ribonuclease R
MTERYTKRILRIMTRRDYQPLKVRALARALNIPDEDYSSFRKAVEALRHEGRIIFGPRNTVCLPEMTNRLVGTFEATSRGFGFVRPDTPTAQGDLFIPSGAAQDAITGDRVVARVTRQRHRGGERKFTGQIVEILERATTQFVGTLEKEGRQWFVQPDGKQLTERIAVDDPGAKNARQGDKVLVEIVSFPTEHYYANGVIIEKLGKSGAASAELKAVIRRFQLEDKFSSRALRDTRKATGTFDPQAAIQGGMRSDIRDQTIITIDPADARDFDDAISLRKLPNGHWLLGVHIADVSHFVQPESRLDTVARTRGTSVYLPQHVIPMLPEILSNGLCSLQENQDRFTKSVYIELDDNGQVQATCFDNSVIRSARRLTYKEVDLILEGKTGGFPKKIINLIRKMERLARQLQKRRQKAGMLTLDLPKADLIYDDQGRVIDAQPESTTFSHTMIEMFMLEANEAVARLLDKMRVPFLRRIHPEPDALATGDSARVLKLCGYMIPKTINRQGLQDILQRVAGKPESFIINLAILKSMSPAEYSPAPIGHYAIASEQYCHFTSPIRRYPDLTVHRLLQAYLDGRLTPQTIRDFPDYETLDELGRHCTRTEQNAEDAENELRNYKILQMLSDHIGDERNAVVTSITNFGMFVQLERFLIEGLIRAEDIERHISRTRGKSKGTRPRRSKFQDWCPYKLGQQLRVRIAAVNLPARTLDLAPV